MGLMAARIMLANPVIKANDRGNLIIRTQGGSIMGLRKAKKQNERRFDQPEIPSLRDTRWEIDSVNNSFFLGYAANGERLLQFETTGWHLKLSCATLRGQWVQNGYSISLSNVAMTLGEKCSEKAKADDIKAAALMKGTVKFRGSQKSEFLLVGNGNWIVADRYRDR